MDTLYKIVQSGHVGILSAGYYLDVEIPGPYTWYAWVRKKKNFKWLKKKIIYSRLILGEHFIST